MPKIKQLYAREILDSRGNPTIETTVTLDNDITATAACPSGASTGKYEAVELRDQDQNHYLGLGVQKAVDNVHKLIFPHINTIEITNQQDIDRAMIERDGTQNKSTLGANAILSVSMAVAKAAAISVNKPLYEYINGLTKHTDLQMHMPTPMFNILNGGKHADGNLDIQEFMVIPASNKPFHEALEIGVIVYKKLQKVLHENHLSTLIGDEGGFAPDLANNEEALAYIGKAVEAGNYRLGYDVFAGLDAAASSFFNEKAYHLKGKAAPLSSVELADFYMDLINKYHILYVEDPFEEDDFDGFATLYGKTTSANSGTIVVGDDLTVTNPFRLQMALDKKTISGILIKPNQIGTVMETIAVIEMAREAGLKIIVSHRSGETTDDFIADFAVGTVADYAKLGAPARGERLAKYNRLLQIEQELKSKQSNAYIK